MRTRKVAIVGTGAAVAFAVVPLADASSAVRDGAAGATNEPPRSGPRTRTAADASSRPAARRGAARPEIPAGPLTAGSAAASPPAASLPAAGAAHDRSLIRR
jgi:hypothetical protein